MTSSAGGFGSTAWAITMDGKTLAVESDADLVPGNNLGHAGQIFMVKLTP